MRNWYLKLFSLLAAVLLFRFVTSEGNSSVIGFSVPVEVRNLPQGKTLIWPLAPTAQVTIKGPSIFASSVAASPPTIKVRVPNDVPNSYVASFKKADIAVPPNVEVLSIEPPEMQLTFDNVISRDVPIEVVRLGNVPAGVKVDDIVITPAGVSLRGPETRIKDLLKIQTEPVDLRDVTTSFSREVQLQVPGSRTEANPSVVRLEVKVSPVRASRRFENVPVEIRSRGGEKLELVKQGVAIEVTGPKEKIETLGVADVIPYVRVPAEASFPYDASASAELPEDISLVLIDPAKVQVVRSPAAAAPKKVPAPKKTVTSKK